MLGYGNQSVSIGSERRFLSRRLVTEILHTSGDVGRPKSVLAEDFPQVRAHTGAPVCTLYKVTMPYVTGRRVLDSGRRYLQLRTPLELRASQVWQ